MIRFLYFTAVCCLLCGINTLHAGQHQLSGRIINQDLHPVAYAEIRLLTDDSSNVIYTTTDTAGLFMILASEGRYQLLVETFGTLLDRRMLWLSSDTTLGDIHVHDVENMEGITMTARKQLLEQKADRLVFHVAHSATASGGTALDVLKSVPTVRVQNDVVSIVGKGAVLVMIDDRLLRIPEAALADFLRSIPSDQIKSIEVITTPPAQYDAEGNNGLINIRMKKAAPDSWNTTLGATYTQQTYAGLNVHALLNYQRRKFTLQTSVNTGSQQLRTTSASQIFYPAERWQQNILNNSRNRLLHTSLDITYRFRSGWTSGLKYMGSFTGQTSESTPLTNRYSQTADTLNGYITSAVSSRNRPFMHTLSWYHTIALDSSGKRLTVDIDYLGYNQSDRRRFSATEYDHRGHTLPQNFSSSVSTNSNNIQNYSFKTDLLLPYAGGSVTVGGKISYTHTGNDLGVIDLETGVPVWNGNLSNIFSYSEYNEAFYISAGKTLGKRWETQAGLRLEATQTAGRSQTMNQTHTTQYIKFFPTAYLTYTPGTEQTFSLRYNRRIRRPDFDYLNPFVMRTNPYFYSEGNPFLKPAYIDNIEYTYTHKQNWVSSLYYNHTSGFAQELAVVDATTNIKRLSPFNYADISQTGISTYYNFSKWPQWNSFTGLNANYQQVKSRLPFIASISGWNAYLYTNNELAPGKTKNLLLGINYALQLPGRYQIFHISAMHILDVSVKVVLPKQHITLTLAATDLLNGQKPVITYYSNEIRNTATGYGDTRGFRLAFLYNFGQETSKSAPRDNGNAEEQSRVR